jgi:hypothetical protein
MQKIWFDLAWNDYLYWQFQDKKTLKRINQLIRDVERDPFKIASGNSRQFNCRDESEPASSAATHCLAYNKIL